MSLSLETVVAFLLALWGAVSAFVALTPTKVDDAALSKFRSFLEHLSFFQPKNSPGVLSMPGRPPTPPLEPLDPAAIEAEASDDEDGAP